MKNQSSPILRFIYSIDLPLLLFVAAFSVDKVLLKIFILVLAILWVRKDLKLTAFYKAPRFYVLLPLLAFVQLLFFNTDFSEPHIVSFCIGIIYWLACLMAFVIVYIRVSAGQVLTIKRTISTIFLINFCWSLGQLLMVMYHAGTINPYASRSILYGNSTGDYIRGIFLGPCYINMFINSLFCIFYIYEKKYLYSVMAVLVICFTTCNFGNLIFSFVLLVLFFTIKKRNAKIWIGSQILIFIVFYLCISFGNLYYMMVSLTVKKSSLAKLRARNSYIDTAALLTPNGKTVSVKETYRFLTGSPAHFLVGAGIGNFSSMLALRTSDIEYSKSSRLFQMLPRHVSPDFYNNHYQIFSEIYKLPVAYHSTRHLPSSFLNQIFGEYGFIGFLLFVFTYIGYFVKRYRYTTYSLIMLFTVCCYLLFDYLFEYLSVMVFFEMFFLLDFKQKKEAQTTV